MVGGALVGFRAGMDISSAGDDYIRLTFLIFLACQIPACQVARVFGNFAGPGALTSLLLAYQMPKSVGCCMTDLEFISRSRTTADPTAIPSKRHVRANPSRTDRRVSIDLKKWT